MQMYVLYTKCCLIYCKHNLYQFRVSINHREHRRKLPTEDAEDAELQAGVIYAVAA